jgi:HK97 gp10 family phage protein
MPVNFSAAAIFKRVSAQIEDAINETAQAAALNAQQRAPVRKVFAAARGASIHGFGARRVLAAPGRLRFNNPLTTRGRYELRTGRANIQVGSRTYLGGRLRSEIYAEPASGGPVFIATVLSPTPYAKYVEFGTRHNRAQPYLRPALADQRSAYRERLATAIGQ